MRMRRNVLYVASSALPYFFPNYLINGTILEKKKKSHWK
jgi:hypothetical protein